MNYAILLAGGSGARMQMEQPKQYLRVADRMIITYALLPLLSCEMVDAICIVALEAWREHIRRDIPKEALSPDKPVFFADAGENRQLSILSGLEEIIRRAKAEDVLPAAEDTVLIHDAARPLLSKALLARCYEALDGHDAVMPALPMKDTVYRSTDGEHVTELLTRAEIFAGQAPELFRFMPYYQANKALLPARIHAISGAAEVAFLAGMDVALVAGDERNFKITDADDLVRFSQLIDGGFCA